MNKWRHAKACSLILSWQPPEKQYKPHKNIVPCSNPRCAALHWPNPPRCKHPNDQCDYEIEYGDGGSSIGALVTDLFPLRFSNGSVFNVPLTFGYYRLK